MKSKKQEGFDYQNFEKEALKALYEGKPLKEALGPLLKRIVEAGLQGEMQGKSRANQTHYEVGKKVRQTIKELGGTTPEDLPTEESIKKLEGAEKKKRFFLFITYSPLSADK